MRSVTHIRAFGEVGRIPAPGDGDADIRERFEADLDLSLSTEAGIESVEKSLVSRIGEAASRDYVPKLYGHGHNQFQLTRGSLGLSL